MLICPVISSRSPAKPSVAVCAVGAGDAVGSAEGSCVGEGCCVAPDEGEGVGVKTDCVAKAAGVTDANTLGTAEAAFLSV